MAIFAERVFKDEKEKIKYQRRIEGIKKKPSAVPGKVSSAYVPSGSIEGFTIPKLIISGIKGGFLGTLAGAATSLICVGIFLAFNKIGSCAGSIYALASLGYFLSPVLIGIIGGVIIGKDAKSARCRSPLIAFFTVFIFSLIFSVLTYFYIEPFLLSFVHKFWVYAERGEFNSLPRSMRGGLAWYIINGVILLTNITAGPIIAYYHVKSQKFCEDCMNYLTEDIIWRTGFDNTNNLILGLLEREDNYLKNMNLLYIDPNPKSLKEGNYIVHSSCSCGSYHLIDVIYYWITSHNGSDYQKKKLIFSEKFTSREVEELKKVLHGGIEQN